MRNLIVLVCLLSLPQAIFAQNSEENSKVERAILNYIEAFYEADTVKAIKSVATDIAKRGYYRKDGQYVEDKMSYGQLVELSKRWKNNQKITEASPKKVTLFEVLNKTASAKVESSWGIDYLHLAKIDGEWKIINVIWQTYPPKP